MNYFHITSTKDNDTISEEDFMKYAPEVNISDDSVFIDKDQRISFKLLNAKEIEDIYTIYRDENKAENPLSPEISTVYLLNFLWSLGLHCYEFQLKLSEKDKENLNAVLISKLDSFI